MSGFLRPGVTPLRSPDGPANFGIDEEKARTATGEREIIEEGMMRSDMTVFAVVVSGAEGRSTMEWVGWIRVRAGMMVCRGAREYIPSGGNTSTWANQRSWIISLSLATIAATMRANLSALHHAKSLIS